jgi:predicted transposase YdaD
MHKPYDITMKMLMEQEPVAWLRRFGIEPDGPVSVVESEVSTITSEVDKVFKIDGAEPYLVHIENQTSPDPDMPWRMNRYNVLVAKDGEYPVLSVLVLLRRSAEAKDLTGVHERKVPGFGLVSLFNYPIVRVWELDVESILNGELSLLPLAPLADVAEESIPDVFRRIDERVMRETETPTACMIMVSTLLLAGMRLERDQILDMMRRFSSMNLLQESSFYQMLLEEGEKKGRIKEAREMLLGLVEARFGAVDASFRQAIEAIDDLETLKRMGKKVITVSNPQELFSSS